MHDVVEHGGPPCQSELVAHGVHLDLALAQVVHQFTEAGALELTFDHATFRQGVESLAIVE